MILVGSGDVWKICKHSLIASLDIEPRNFVTETSEPCIICEDRSNYYTNQLYVYKVGYKDPVGYIIYLADLIVICRRKLYERTKQLLQGEIKC